MVWLPPFTVTRATMAWLPSFTIARHHYGLAAFVRRAIALLLPTVNAALGSIGSAIASSPAGGCD